MPGLKQATARRDAEFQTSGATNKQLLDKLPHKLEALNIPPSEVLPLSPLGKASLGAVAA